MPNPNNYSYTANWDSFGGVARQLASTYGTAMNFSPVNPGASQSATYLDYLYKIKQVLSGDGAFTFNNTNPPFPWSSFGSATFISGQCQQSDTSPYSVVDGNGIVIPSNVNINVTSGLYSYAVAAARFAAGDVFYQNSSAFANLPNALSVASVASSGSLTESYTIIGISRVFANNGGIFGGSLIWLSGLGFSDIDPASVTVKFDGILATNVKILGDAVIECVNPPHAVGAVDIVVRFYLKDNPGAYSTLTLVNAFTYLTYTWQLKNLTLSNTNVPLIIQPGDTIKISSPNNSYDFTTINRVDIGLTAFILSSNFITWTPLEITLIVPTSLSLQLTPIGIEGTQFSGSAFLASVLILLADSSGIYSIVSGKTSDTLYVIKNSSLTVDSKIPDPFAKTGFIGG